MNGERCDQCRDGTYNLNDQNAKGCSECFCSGTTRVCTSSRLFREQIPLSITSEKLLLTSRIEGVPPQSATIVDVSTNTISIRIRDENTYYWSLPDSFLGNQLNSYGGDLLFTVRNDASGEYVHDQDVILNGNGLSLFWIRKNVNELTTTVRLVESEWQTIDRTGPRVASKADLITVLSNLESFLIRATVKEGAREAHLSDVVLDTAVEQTTGQEPVTNIEVCRCPEGYTGNSCEVCKFIN